MPLSGFVPLTRHFIQKPLRQRIQIVNNLWKARCSTHLVLFAAAYVVPNTTLNEEILMNMQYTL